MLHSLSSIEKQNLVELSNRFPMAEDSDETQVVHRDDWVQLTSPTSKSWFMNQVKHSQIEPGAVDATIKETLENYKASGVNFSWSVGPSTQPENMGEKLVANGFVQKETTIGMIIDSDVAESWAGDSRISHACLDNENFEGFVQTQIEGWDISASAADWLRQKKESVLAGESKMLRTVLSFYDGKPAGAAAYMLVDGRTMHLIGGSVSKYFRGKGIYRDSVRHRLLLAKEFGIPYVTVHCIEDTSAPICKKMGFEPVCKFYRYASPNEK